MKSAVRNHKVETSSKTGCEKWGWERENRRGRGGKGEGKKKGQGSDEWRKGNGKMDEQGKWKERNETDGKG